LTRLPSFVLSLAAGALLLAACGTSGSSGTASTPAPSPTPAPVVKTATAMVAGQSMTILVGASNGMTLYYYTPDKGAGKVTCTGACLTAWPPLLLSGADTKPTGDKSVTGTLGTIASPNGGMQVTYKGWPLYFWTKDTAPGDTTGQNFGGKGFVVPPDVPANS
jgi:predicted lipoprotein with Yx(FWY)xxD motif